MLIEDLKTKYTTIPFATNTRNHKRNILKNNIDTLFHIHKEVEIMLVLDGKAKVYIDTKSFEIEKGDIIFISPFVPHRYTILSDFDFNHYCICFDLELLHDNNLKEKLEGGTLDITSVVKNDEISAELIKKAFEANEKKAKSWELQVIGNLMLLFARLIEYEHIFNTSSSANKSIYFQILDYIAHNFSADVTSMHISNYLHMNNSYFCRLFRKNFGCCFQNYLCMYRIDKSKSLLKNTDMSISEIAARVGFNSISYYSKKFKEHTSLRPSEYRHY